LSQGPFQGQRWWIPFRIAAVPVLLQPSAGVVLSRFRLRRLCSDFDDPYAYRLMNGDVVNTASHDYVPPQAQQIDTLPPEIIAYLDGTDLLAKTQALRISTVDAENWPHASLLSAGDMVAMPLGRLRFAIFAQSSTTANILRDQRVTVTYSHDGGMCELRLMCRRLADAVSFPSLALFEGELVAARFHKAPYASVSSGITFEVHEKEPVLARWQRQIEALRAAC
jgi:Pyridoxamine 5'-phosphate oxidase